LALSFSKGISGTTPYYNLIRRVAFPSTRAIAISSILLVTFGVGLSFLVVEHTAKSFILGVTGGVVVLGVPALLSNLFLFLTIVREDPLFYPRRCLAFSLFTITSWVAVFLIGSVLSFVLSRFVFPGSAIIAGLFAVIPLRAVAVFSMSRTSFLKRIIFTLTEPSLTALTSVLVLGVAVNSTLSALALSSLIGLAFAFALILVVENFGRQAIGFSPIRMFRAFLTDWLEGQNSDLESYLNELGVETEIDVAAFLFRRSDTARIKGTILVSNFHPGPFLNIGSSVLPFLFQALMKRRFNAVSIVPHGVSGHEFNLVSQEQNMRIIEWILLKQESVRYDSEATAVTRASNGIATATSQIFDNCALVTMTTAPYDMEDVPSDIANRIGGLTHGRFRHVALIDAHNCLTGPSTMTPDKMGALQEATLSSLQVSAEQPGNIFKVGVAQRTPAGFTLKDGYGPGGISVIGIEVDQQRFAYINIDGNNMIRGLRERILNEAKQAGFDDGEVMTTDTHMVNGVVPARLGYHMIGEVGSKTLLLHEVCALCREAIADLQPCEVGVINGQIPVTTLGSKSLKRVMNLVHRVSRLTALTLFPVVLAATAFSLLFLV